MFKYPRPPSALQVANLRTCVKERMNTGGDCESSVFLHVRRDPRDVAVSTCFHVREADSLKLLEDCVRARFPTIAVWTAARCHVISSSPRGRFVDVVYERMLAQPEVNIAAIADILHLPCSQEQARLIAEETNADSLRNTTRFNMHDMGAGTRNYTSYGLSSDTLEWLDVSHQLLSDPCTRLSVFG